MSDEIRWMSLNTLKTMVMNLFKQRKVKEILSNLWYRHAKLKRTCIAAVGFIFIFLTMIQFQETILSVTVKQCFKIKYYVLFQFYLHLISNNYFGDYSNRGLYGELLLYPLLPVDSTAGQDKRNTPSLYQYMQVFMVF